MFELQGVGAVPGGVTINLPDIWIFKTTLSDIMHLHLVNINFQVEGQKSGSIITLQSTFLILDI